MEFGPQAIEIGNIQIRYYGLIIVAAILIAASVAARLAKRQGKDPDHIWGAMFLAVILGIVGARLWYVLFPPVSAVAAGRDTAWYFANFFNLQDGAIAIWSGGLHIFGAFMGGFIGAYLYLRQNKLNVLEWLDIAAVALPLGQFIGRWANYVNQELYGLPTGVSWLGLSIDREFRVGEFTRTTLYPLEGPTETLFHPLFLYEGLLMLVVFFVLLRLFNTQRDTLKPGTLFFLYLASYSVVRYALEFLRIEVNLFRLYDADGNVTTRINTSQLVAGIGFVIALVGLAPRWGAIQWGKVFSRAQPVEKKRVA
ncbi:MAG: prolipoprotein diacylglyceryl transferase [Anaerolineae bacterium]|jgi:phosphatidylglycerol:prolipoprotein diacylglycerol transferase|nr:prolipoprotein diacylglyceryl transferase [Anaerolineae bacterium]